jgi:N-alpha-acetyltransferase 40
MRRVDLNVCLNIIEETSKPDYMGSSKGWNRRAKLEEMKSEFLRYILVRNAAGEIRAFTSMMPTVEQGQKVVYCYEIHLKPDLRG